MCIPLGRSWRVIIGLLILGNLRQFAILPAHEHRKLTPYQGINDLLGDWKESVKNVLGEKVVGLYLSGSLAYGGFVPERSDID
jgi:hypothetical protein